MSLSDPTDFERPVTMPDGSLSAAKFRIFQWPIAEAPGGLRIFACQHKTRETVWIPELMKHANGAKRLKQVLVVSPEAAKDAAHLARMIDSDVRAEADGAVASPSGSDRADFVFLTKDQLGRRYPEVAARGAARARRRGPRARNIRSCSRRESDRQRGRSQRSGCLRRACRGQWRAAGLRQRVARGVSPRSQNNPAMMPRASSVTDRRMCSSGACCEQPG